MNEFVVDETTNLAVDGEIYNLPTEGHVGSEISRDVGFEPYEEMKFASKKTAYDFYNAYGYILGFSIRENSSYMNKQGIITSMRLVCSKQGLSRRQKSQLEEPIETNSRPNMKTPEKQVSEKRSCCKALFHVRLHGDGVWRVTDFHKDHNHEFIRSTPSKKRHL
jgi:FAR1 DNA-binding domain